MTSDLKMGQRNQSFKRIGQPFGKKNGPEIMPKVFFEVDVVAFNFESDQHHFLASSYLENYLITVVYYIFGNGRTCF